MNQPTLKPCPFCGGRPAEEFSEMGSRAAFGIHCTECDAKMGYLYKNSMQLAKDNAHFTRQNWNQRVK